LDDIYSRLAEIKPEGMKKKLEAGRESAYFSRDLIRLREDLDPVPGGPESLVVGEPDKEKARKMFSELGMKSLANRFGHSGELFDAESSGAAARSGEPAAIRADAGALEGSNAPASLPAIPKVEVPESLRGEGAYETITEQAALDAWIASIKKAGRFAFDCETDSLDELSATPVGFSLSVAPKAACYVPVKSPDAACLPEDKLRTALDSLFSDPRLTMVGQNVKFDFKVMRSWGLEIRCRLEDSMVAAWMLDPGRTGTAGGGGYNLEALAERYLEYKGIAFSDIVPKGGVFSSVPIAQAGKYAAEDADLALRLMDAFLPALESEGLLGLFRDVEMPLIPIMAEMEIEGIRLDSKALGVCAQEMNKEIDSTEKEIYALVGHEFNIASTKQLQDVLFNERKLQTGKKTKTGFSTDTSVLEELALEDPVCEKVLRYRGLKKLVSTYVEALPLLADANGRVHTHYIQTGAATGRLSSRDPNLQNIPIREAEGRRIREAFTADKGKILVSLDYSQIELVVLAHLSGDPGLKEAFALKADVHRRTAALIFGKKEEDVSGDERRIAKTINFGVIYGMSAYRLAAELKISRSDAQKFIDAYFATYRGVTEFTRTAVADAERTGRARTILGRIRPIDNINSRNKTEKAGAERVAVNTPIQGSAADIVKLAMLAVHAALKKEEPGARILLQVHDELLIECPVGRAESVMKIAQREMEKAYALNPPLRVQAEKALSWGDMH
jgi:DNA polymerase-1